MASIRQQFLVPVSTVSARRPDTMNPPPPSPPPPFVYKIRRKTLRNTSRKVEWGVCSTLPETLTLFQNKICDFPYPISDLIKNLVPYFRPEPWSPARDRSACVTSCYATYKVGINIKREMVLSPNDEEVASSKKHTQFTYPISDQKG